MKDLKFNNIDGYRRTLYHSIESHKAHDFQPTSSPKKGLADAMYENHRRRMVQHRVHMGARILDTIN